ncbi:MAG: hypothetical protein ACYC3I_21850 [Gemmataceae bacterium]
MNSASLRSGRTAIYAFFLSTLCTLFLGGAVRADELNEPYNLLLVVHVAKNRLLTDVFRERIERELHDGFQAALGDMGRVTVTHEHPRLADVLTRGLRSLDEWKDRQDRKTHFVLIDYSGVHYEIRTRQYDGTIGRASPVVRRDRTRDRDFVAKAAALLIKKDFGVLGTVREEPDGAKQLVKIELRGGALGDMARWVKKDDVFALAPPDGGSPSALRWSLLQVEQAPSEESRDGVCVCRFFHRYRVANIAGYRCIKLGTVSTPLRIRWMQQLTGGRVKPLDRRLTVEIRRFGFEGEEQTKLSSGNDLNGVLETVGLGKDGVFDNVAFVSVIDGMDGPNLPRVPIALVDDQPVSIEVNASRDYDTLFTVSKASWQSNVADSVQMLAGLFKRLEELGAKSENRGEIIQVARSGLNRARAAREKLRTERQDLAKEAKLHNNDLKTPLEDRRLKQLDDYEQALTQFLAEQEKIERTESDPQQKKWRSAIESARLLEKDLEIGKAIDIYEAIRKEGYKQADFESYLAKLHKMWDTRNEEYKEARGFIYRVWPTLDSEHLEENIPKAEEAFKKCKDARDLDKFAKITTIKKLLRGTLGHADRLTKELEELNPEQIPDDEKPALQKKKISEQIAKLGLAIQRSLQILADDK